MQKKNRDIIDINAYMQKFEFICGIKLSIVLYDEVDKIAKNM